MKILQTSLTNLDFSLNIISKRKTKIPKNPRKERSKIFALQYLIHKNINYLPINLETINYVLDNYEWIVFTYEDAKSVMQVEDPFNIKKRKALARTLHERGTNIFVTVFVEDKQFPRRDYFTLAHELGHIVLGHFFEFEKTSLLRSGLIDEEYAVLEREAEIFAAELLMPMPVLKGINVKSYEDIVNICKVTKTSAKIRMEEFQKFRLANRIIIPYIVVKKQFQDFIYKRYCPNCRYYCISDSFTYCPICGQHLQWGEGTMIYNDGYELDENGRALKCPICGNEEIGENGEERYCIICGTYLVNRCTHQEDEYNNYTGEIIKPACGKIAPGNARYCPYCGTETTFYRNNLLSSWEDAQMQILEEQQKTKEEVATTFDNNNDDDFNFDDTPF